MKKECIQCHATKEESEFAKKRDKRANTCKKCHQVWCKAHYNKNKNTYYKRNKRNKALRRGWLDTLKDGPCADCKNSYPPYVMDFDHLGDKLFNISDQLRRVGKQKILNEINKCELVCANCHRIRTHKRNRDVA